jgi:DNA-binding transcriptional LysR family regulator
VPRTSEAKVTRPVAQLANLDLNLLVILRELIRERNVTRAAERVAVTQPAASAALARLRRHFDDELLVRRGGDYLLSPLAAQLAEHVEAACSAAERVFAAETEFDPLTSNREFTLLMADYTLAVIGDRLSALVEREAPNVRLHILLVHGPLAGEAEELIRRIDGIVSPPLTALMVPHVRSAELFRDRWVCVCWKGNTALKGGAPSVADLARMNWVAPFVPDRGRTSSAPLLAQLAILGIQPHVSVRVESYQAVPFLLTGTDRVAMMQARLAEKLAEPLDLRIMPCPGASEVIVEALWWCEDYDDDPAHRWLRQNLQMLAAEV